MLNFNISESIRSISGFLIEFASPDSRKVAGFDVARAEKCGNFKLPTLIFCLFSRNLSRISKKKNRLSKTK